VLEWSIGTESPNECFASWFGKSLQPQTKAIDWNVSKLTLLLLVLS